MDLLGSIVAVNRRFRVLNRKVDYHQTYRSKVAGAANIATCLILEGRKRLAIGLFTSSGPLSQYSLSAGCSACTYFKHTPGADDSPDSEIWITTFMPCECVEQHSLCKA